MNVLEVNLSNYFDMIKSVGDSIGANNPDADPKKLASFAEILANIEPSEAYLEFSDRISAAMEEYFDTIDWYQSQADYAAASLSEKLKFPQEIVNHQAEIARGEFKKFGDCKLNLPNIPVKWVDNIEGQDGGTLFSINKLDPRIDHISLNSECFYMSEYIGQSVRTATHEGRHLINVALGQGVASGAIKEDHPLYHDGLYFMNRIEREAYYTIAPAYNSEMDERVTDIHSNRLTWWLEQNAPQTLKFIHRKNGQIVGVRNTDPSSSALNREMVAA